MEQVFITDLMAHGMLGVDDWERERPQRMLAHDQCRIVQRSGWDR